MALAWFKVPRIWAGQPAFIVGGGPSLKGFDASVLRGKGRVFAINNSYLLAPWADVLFWGDRRWYDWNHKDLHKHYGLYKISTARPVLSAGLDIKLVRNVREKWTNNPECVTGTDSGRKALNVAVHFGCNPIYLLGFDMHQAPTGENNWHNLHKLGTQAKRYRNIFIPTYEHAVPFLKKLGVKVYNCTPGSALKCFPFIDLASVLSGTIAA